MSTIEARTFVPSDEFWIASLPAQAPTIRVDRCIDGTFSTAESHANDSTDGAYADNRRLRTRRVVDYGWRTVDLLVDGLDEDCYDKASSDTRTVILSGRDGAARGGMRLTRVRTITDALSVQMWGSTLPDDVLSDPTLNKLVRSRAVVDSTRMFFAPSFGAALSIPLLGACVAATSGKAGTLFTASERLHTMMSAADLPFRTLHEGELGQERCALLLFDQPHMLDFDDPAIDHLLTVGAFAIDPIVARTLPFFRETAIADHETVLSEPVSVRPAS